MRSADSAILLLLAACGTAAPTTTTQHPALLTVSVATTGSGAAPARFKFLIDESRTDSVAPNSTTEVSTLSGGTHEVRLTGIPVNCTSDWYAPQPVALQAGVTVGVAFAVECEAPGPSGLVSVSPAGLWRSNLDGGNLQPLLSTSLFYLAPFAVNPARTRLVFAQSSYATIARLDGSASKLFSGENLHSVDWSPDGSRLAISKGVGHLFLIWADGRGETEIVDHYVEGARWSPDGTKLAYRDGYYIYVRDVASGSFVNTQHQLSDAGGLPAWSPDGTRIAFVNLGTQTLYTMKADGSDLVAIPVTGALTLHSVAGSLEWTADGKILLTECDPACNVLSVPAAGGTLSVLLPGRTNVRVLK